MTSSPAPTLTQASTPSTPPVYDPHEIDCPACRLQVTLGILLLHFFRVTEAVMGLFFIHILVSPRQTVCHPKLKEKRFCCCCQVSINPLFILTNWHKNLAPQSWHHCHISTPVTALPYNLRGQQHPIMAWRRTRSVARVMAIDDSDSFVEP